MPGQQERSMEQCFGSIGGSAVETLSDRATARLLCETCVFALLPYAEGGEEQLRSMSLVLAADVGGLPLVNSERLHLRRLGPARLTVLSLFVVC